MVLFGLRSYTYFTYILFGSPSSHPQGEWPDFGKVKLKGWECSGSKYCCSQAITDFFKVYQFKNLFTKCNYPVAKAFITAAAMFEVRVFCTTGVIDMQIIEQSIFHDQVDAKTSCN